MSGKAVILSVFALVIAMAAILAVVVPEQATALRVEKAAAFEAGRAAGAAGLPPEANPYRCGQHKQEAWAEGWVQGALSRHEGGSPK